MLFSSPPEREAFPCGRGSEVFLRPRPTPDALGKGWVPDTAGRQRPALGTRGRPRLAELLGARAAGFPGPGRAAGAAGAGGGERGAAETLPRAAGASHCSPRSARGRALSELGLPPKAAAGTRERGADAPSPRHKGLF